MQTKYLKVLVENFVLAIEKEATQEPTNDNTFPKIKRELIKNHSIAVYESFSSLVSKEQSKSDEVSLDDIRNQLEKIWIMIRGTGLSYTALPQHEVTKFLIQVAYEALKTNSKNKSPSLLEVIHLLMPTLKLKEIPNLYTPNDCGYELSNYELLNTEAPVLTSASEMLGENSTEKENLLNQETITQFLRSHLIADSGEYIIPLWSLNKMALDPNNEKIDNVYYQFSESYEAPHPTQLTQAECNRLNEHNPITQYIHEIKKHLKEYENDQSTLLGQLFLLSKSLYFNSIFGIGKEGESGSTAEMAIRKFFEYFKTLDQTSLDSVLTPKLKQELVKLRHCIGIYYAGEHPIAPIETCMATRRDNLQAAIEDHADALAGIGSSKTTLKTVIKESHDSLKQQLVRLNQAIQQNKVEGYEQLPITKKLLIHYNLNLNVSDLESLIELLNGLTAEEITNLFHTNYLNSWSSAIPDLENLVLLFLQLSNEKTEVLCKFLSATLKKKFLENKKDYIALLLLLPREKKQIVSNYFIDPKDIINKDFTENLLYLSINNLEIFAILWNLLSKEQQLEAVRLQGAGGNTLLHSVDNEPELLKLILEHLPQSKLLEIIKILNTSKRSILHNTVSKGVCFRVILNFLEKKEALEALYIKDYCGNTPLHIAAQHDVENFKTILEFYPDNEKKKFIMLINDAGDSVFNISTHQPEILKNLLTLFSENEIAHILKLKNCAGFTPLHLAAINHPESFNILIKLYPANELFEMINSRDPSGSNMLNIVGPYHETFTTILNLYQEDARFDAIINGSIVQGDSLYRIAPYTKCITEILKLLPPKKRLEALKVRNNASGDTIAYRAGFRIDALKALLESLTEDERLTVLKMKTFLGETPLHRICLKIENLETILKLLPLDKRLEIVKLKNCRNLSVLFSTSDNLENVKRLLLLFPQGDRWEALKLKNNFINLTLYRYVDAPKSLKTILELLNPNQILELLKVKDKSNQTFLERVISYPNSFKTILRILPEGKRVEALKIQNANGTSLLSILSQSPKTVEILHEILTTNERLELSKTQNQNETMNNGSHLSFFSDISIGKINININPAEKTKLSQEFRGDL